jgi:hypothetical protein
VSGSVQAGSNKSAIVTALTQPANAPGPTAAPVITDTRPANGVNLNERTMYAVATYVSALGESLPSPQGLLYGVRGDYVSIVASPSSASGVIGWNCYLGTSPGDEFLQNGSPLAIGTPYQEPNLGAIQGSRPPTLATNGYFSKGVVYFTSGQNAGQIRVCTQYTNNGSNNVLNIIPPLPYTPAPGDSLQVLPGCDRRPTTCAEKFSNLIHFGGQPWIPQPESTV